MTATRCAIGVVPGAIAVTVCGMSTVSGSGSAAALDLARGSGTSPLLHAASAVQAKKARAACLIMA
jgi:hypothetical protein